ncbi:MAG: ABC transporter ATP-binding protein/permease [Anaerolineae bacterium]|nr:ABC transporter ATP-binding protein/permease [Anaerolineae bacterium]
MFHSTGWFAYLRQNEKERPTLSWELLRRVLAFAHPYRWSLFLLLLTILSISAVSAMTPLLMRDLIDNALPQRDLSRLNRVALALISIPLVNGLIGVAQRRLSAAIGEGVIYDLRRTLYSHIQRMPLRFFTETRTGELMSRLNNDVVGAQSAVTSTLMSITSNLISLVITLSIMLALEWRLTLLSLLIVPLFLLPARYIGRYLRVLRRRSMELSAEMNATMNETLNVSGALLVKLFGRERKEIVRFTRDAGEVRDIGVRSAVVGQWFFLMLGVTGAVGVAAIYWLGGYMVIENSLTIGTIVAFGSYLTQLYGPLMSLTNAPVEFAQSMVSFERVFEALDLPVDIQEIPQPYVLADVQGHIVFEDVSFSYIKKEGPVGLTEVARFSWHGGNEAHLKRGKQREAGEEAASEMDDEADLPAELRLALQNVSFVIEPGQLVALVGPSGAGKTTITYLLPRLYDPTSGRVLIDGHDIKNVTLNSLAANIGMVTQETYLFYDTIRANLLYAREDASEAEMIAAAQAANIHDFISQLPDGYDTVVGERGYRLSGGERQRIAIARVILKDPRILVLDEATSHLDSLSEALIQEALQRVMRGRTSLVIAHRLSTILAADQILVIDKGQLVECGRHQELITQNGLYSSLYETQFRYGALHSTTL